MAVLLNPVNTISSGIKWALVAHTVAMISFVSIPFGIDLIDSSTCYVDNRDFTGNDVYPPGPIGYWGTLDIKSTATIFYIMFPVNQWLADGLLVGPFRTLSFRGLTQAVPLAVSLLDHLLHELLDHGAPMSDLPRLRWYALEVSTSQGQHVDKLH
jgi:hypothetical protein